MSSSEPRLNRSTPDGSPRELTGLADGDVNPLKSTVPLSTHILLVGIMLLFFSAATLITLQVTWEWWLIPAAIAVPVAVVLTERWTRRRRTRVGRVELDRELRATVRGGR